MASPSRGNHFLNYYLSLDPQIDSLINIYCSDISNCRESFFDKLPGANEKRFVPFNNMPKIYSKYKNSE